MITEYPLFIPPNGLAEKDPINWTKKEADDYFKWLLENLEKRVTCFLKYIEEDMPCGQTIDLQNMGKKVSYFLKSDTFSKGGILINMGYALAADAGLLVAKLLVDACPSVKWSIVRKPKSDISYNLPVLIGFGKIRLDPVGGSIAEAKAILAGRRDSNTWNDMYTFWKQNAT